MCSSWKICVEILLWSEESNPAPMELSAHFPSDATIFILLWSEILIMVFLAKDVKNGKVYLYIRHNYSVNGKSKRAWQVALGPEDALKTSGNIALDLGVHTETLEFGLVLDGRSP